MKLDGLHLAHDTTTRNTDEVFYSSDGDNIYKNTPAGMRSSLNAPTRTGGDASGSWGIDITGNAATATTAGACSGNSATATTAGACSGNSATASQVNNSLTPGSYLSGDVFNGSTDRTFNVDATENATVSKIVARDSLGDIYFRYAHSAYVEMSHNTGTNTGDSIFYSSTDNYIRKNDASGFRTSLNVPTRTGGDASGSWGIDITGNAATATTATSQSGGTVNATTGDFSGQVYTSNSFYTDGNRSVIRGASPTLYFRDTNEYSAMIHNNSNLLYVLRGANDTETWTQVNNVWPWIWNLTNNDSTCGGSLYCYGNVTAYSDIRHKKDIIKLDDSLEKVCELNGYTYTRINDGKRYTGLIAQEVLEVLPEAVTEDEKGEYAVAYGNMAGLFVEAMKEMKSRIDALEKKLEA